MSAMLYRVMGKKKKKLHKPPKELTKALEMDKKDRCEKRNYITDLKKSSWYDGSS